MFQVCFRHIYVLWYANEAKPRPVGGTKSRRQEVRIASFVNTKAVLQIVYADFVHLRQGFLQWYVLNHS